MRFVRHRFEPSLAFEEPEELLGELVAWGDFEVGQDLFAVQHYKLLMIGTDIRKGPTLIF